MTHVIKAMLDKYLTIFLLFLFGLVLSVETINIFIKPHLNQWFITKWPPYVYEDAAVRLTYSSRQACGCQPQFSYPSSFALLPSTFQTPKSITLAHADKAFEQERVAR